MPKGKHNSPKPKKVLPKKAEAFVKQMEDAAKFWDPNIPGYGPEVNAYLEEEIKKFAQGFNYKTPVKNNGVLCKIFDEQDFASQEHLRNEIEGYFCDMEDVEICSMTTNVIEVSGHQYLIIVVLYK